jgi:hypothetical protein
MFSLESLRRIIKISLQPITETRHPLWSQEAEELLVMISAHESRLGKDLKQIGSGPALGLYQIEPDTMHDNYQNFLDNRKGLSGQIANITGCEGPDVAQLQYNPIYGTIHARLKIYRSAGDIPKDFPSMAEYAKKIFNSPQGAATPEQYLTAYLDLIK